MNTRQSNDLSSSASKNSIGSAFEKTTKKK